VGQNDETMARLERERQDARDDLCALVAQHWAAMPEPVREAWTRCNDAMVRQLREARLVGPGYRALTPEQSQAKWEADEARRAENG
jgi:hypothetical protein